MRTMNTVAWILGIILAGGFGVAGVTKLLDLDRMRDHLGYSARQYRLIGLSEVAGAAGVVIGLVSRKLEWVALDCRCRDLLLAVRGADCPCPRRRRK